MDVLSDVLLAVRLTGAIFFHIDARAPFATESPPPEAIADRISGDCDHFIAFHVVTDGSCWASAVDQLESPVLLSAGEMVIYPAGNANILASAPGMRAHPDPSLYYHPVQSALPFPIVVNTDGTGDQCRFACGFLACDSRPFNPLLESLPPMVHAPVSARSWRWMSGLLEAAVEASDGRNAGQEAILAKLSELMFVEALRAHIDRLPPEARSWVAGLRNAEVGAALRLLHGRFAEPWTLELLAREVGMSRSAFADRFTTYVGVPPMTYLARWRLQVAARMLQGGSVSVAHVSAAVGYESESAFNRAFKKQVGAPPGSWRRR
ncbi:MAG TPA: AraC family transcriptional regulator [Kineosporiaceae bacterium]|nr:AraC family transcriptional regulator [Kineosporiaceae bacterium]